MRRTLALLTLLLALPATAAAEPKLDGQFPVDAKPNQLVEGPDGNVWFIMDGTEFGSITPDGTVSDDFAMPGAVTPKDITAGGGKLWISYDDGFVEVDPANPAGATAHPVAEVNTARGIAREADGDLWIVDDFSNSVVEAAPDGTFKREIPGDPVNATPPSGRGIALGLDGKLWWVDNTGPSVQATDPATGTSKGYEVSAGNPQEITAGPEGQMAFTSPNGIIGRIATDTGAIQETPNPGADATGIVLGNDQAYWSAEFATDSVARLAPDGTLTHPIQFTPFAAGDTADPRHIATGPNDTLWVSLEDLGTMTHQRIARITGVEAPPAPDPQPQPQPQPDPQPTCCAPPPPPPDTLAPTLSALSVTPSRVRRGRRTAIRFTLSEAASVALQFDRVRRGRRSNGRCVAPRRRLRRAPRCTRFRRVGALTRQVANGTSTISFDGRLSGRLLPVGSYAVTLVARDAAGNVSRPRTLRFRILPRRRR